MRSLMGGVGLLVVSASGVMVACSSDTATGPQAVTYTATMSAANERNADGSQKTINSTATGLATLTLLGDTLTYTINVNNLTGAAVASHIHVGGPNQNGAIVTPFTITSGVASGTLATGRVVLTTLTAVSADSMRTLLNNGASYVNVHTAAYPGGEMRGQITRQ